MFESETWYSVHVQARAPAGALADVSDDAADALMDLLEDASGVVSTGDGSWDATVSVEAYDALDATHKAATLIHEMAWKAEMPSWPAVRAEAVRQDVLDAENARPTLPDLVSVPEAAEILGVSPQRAHELAGSTSFPKPMYELRTGKLWLKTAIDAYAEHRQRKPGRPDIGARMRERVTSALLDAGLTVADARVWLGHDRTVILQVDGGGSPKARLRAAGKIIAALAKAGLDVTDEGSHSAQDMEAYLAGGHPAEVFELSDQDAAARQALSR
jgi:hypothetical protein